MASVTADTGLQQARLKQRLAGLRRKIRFLATYRGVGALLVILLATALFAGLLDWRFHLPSVIRALFLVSGLSGAGYVVYRYLYIPLSARVDDLSLALQIEEHYPGLNDSLASTVEFLEVEGSSADSPALRREAIRRGLRSIEKCDFRRLIDRRGLWPITDAAVLLLAAAVTLVAWHPELAGIALGRLLHPFGTLNWPKQTRLEIDTPRDRIGRNEAFEVSGRVFGVIPPTATVVFKLDRNTTDTRTCEIAADEDGRSGSFRIRLEAGKVQRNFSFQVSANDSVSPWYDVAVLPPPLLVPLAGRASPQVHLRFPEYTALPEQDLPDGNGNIDAVAGTLVTLRAAADRPLAAAWVEFQPEPRYAEVGLFLAPLGADSAGGVVTALAGGQTVWQPVPAQLSGDCREFTVTFRPTVKGMYALHFQDDMGLHNTRLFDLRIFPDPAPTVTLERPSASRDTLTVLPDATITLQAVAEDAQYALRSVYVEYRTRKADPPRRLPLYDHQVAAATLDRAFARLVGRPGPGQPSAETRLQRWSGGRVLSLKEIHHLKAADGGLKDGDVLTLQVCADDFDDVSVDKQPGRSHEIEIRIVSRNALDLQLNQAQARVQQELVVLRKLQQDALKKVVEAQARLKQNGKLTPEDADQLLQAEQIQQQVRERVGDREQGLQSEVRRILETLRENHLPRTAAQERMEAVDRELERLANEELPQIEPRLTNARKQNAKAEAEPKPPEEGGPRQLLKEARQHQEEVDKTFGDLLSRLEPWTSTHEIKGETKALLEEQRRLQQQTEEMQQHELRRPDAKVRGEQDAALEKARSEQQKLAERTQQLLDKMDRVAQDRKDQDPQTAQELENAARQGRDDNIADSMQQAKEHLQNNQLGRAGEKQREAAEKLEKLARTLEDRREAELDRLLKKLRQAEKEMAEMEKEQERLRKKIKEAEQIADPEQRKQELQRLAREQEKLQQKAEEMARQLSRQRAERSAQALAKAAEQMQEAVKRLERGESGDDQQEEALDRLQEAREELEQKTAETEEELAREQLAKVADEIKRLRERQQGLLAEGQRIQRELLQRKPEDWRGLLISLGRLADAQGIKDGLAHELTGLAEKKLDGAPVFARVLHKAADVMDQASQKMLEHRDEVNANGKPETTAGAEAARLQAEALARLDQLLAALKEGEANPMPARRRNDDDAGGGDGGAGGGGGGGGDGIPAVAELKLLRQLQAEVNKRTEEFRKQHPDPNKLDDKAKTELQDIRRAQQEVAELLEEMMPPEPPEGDMP